MTTQRSLIIGLFTSSLWLISSTAAADHKWFWPHWSDGQAEVNQYTLTQPRYGEERVGRATLIYVTEPFSKSRRVKVDRYNEHDPDHTIALKLNRIESWRTGVYEYRLMTSHFYDLLNALSPLKVTFSSQEWCGVTYEESHWSKEALLVTTESYFEGESSTHPLSSDHRFTDQLFVYGRGLLIGGPQNLNKLSSSLIESAKIRFLHHRKPVAYNAEARWEAVRTMKTKLGSYEVIPLSFKKASGVKCTINIEVLAPYRIFGWSCEDGERAELELSVRSPYWRQTRLVDERALIDSSKESP